MADAEEGFGKTGAESEPGCVFGDDDLGGFRVRPGREALQYRRARVTTGRATSRLGPRFSSSSADGDACRD